MGVRDTVTSLGVSAGQIDLCVLRLLLRLLTGVSELHTGEDDLPVVDLLWLLL